MSQTAIETNVRPATTDAYTALFVDAVKAAQTAGASDLHIEPSRTGVAIRMRVLGDMKAAWKEIGADHRQAFIGAVKRATGLEIGVSGRPQDGRFVMGDLRLDFRVSLLPTLYGEKIVLRLLDQTRSFNLCEVGLEDDARINIAMAMERSDGVVLISGPTGSGKTTTLYSILASMDLAANNVVTLEDPIEYSLAGINQVQITSKLTFASALRAVLRQDPDVILVGEIRDRETADLAFQAAATGHLVLSTVHANGATEVVTRLLGLGVERYLIETNLRFSGAQRLVKALCRKCSYGATKCSRDWLMEKLDGKLPILKDMLGGLRLRGKGCPACNGGFHGRVPILEYLDDHDIADAGSTKPIECSRTLAEACLQKVINGEVDFREVVNFV